MPDYTPHSVGRWTARTHARAIAMRRTDHLNRLIGFGMLTTGTLVLVIFAIWR